MNAVVTALSALSPLTALEPVLLSFIVEKYIEGAGSAPGAMLDRAKTVKTIASEIDGAVLGTISLTDLASLATNDLASRNIPISTQTLITGLMSVLGSSVPVAGPLLKAAAQAEANVALQTVIAACAKFGA